MNSMYVWEVRQVEAYEMLDWRELIKDDSDALNKIKKVLFFLYTHYCFDEGVKKEQIEKIEGLGVLEDEMSFFLSPTTSIEVEKVKVL